MTEELLKIQVKNDQQLVSARDLHRGLGLTTRFSKWVEQNFKDFELGEDYTSVTAVTVVGNGGHKPIQDYALTIDMAKQLCLMSHTDKGREYRKYLIEIERKWNDPQEIVRRGYAILQNENTQLMKRRGSDYNSPTQKSMERGLFRVKESVITHSDGHTTISKTSKVTGKGQIYFVNKFLNSDNPDTAQFREEK